MNPPVLNFRPERREDQAGFVPRECPIPARSAGWATASTRAPASVPRAGCTRRAAPLLVVGALLAAVGCGGRGDYRIEMNLPWPDEAPRRAEAAAYARELNLSRPTLAWHARMDRRTLAQQITQAAASPAVYVYTRDALARRARGDGPRTVRVLEARIGLRCPAQVGGASVESMLPSGRMPAAARYVAFTVRSHEYDSAGDFLRAARETSAALSSLPTESSTAILPLADWLTRMAELRRTAMARLLDRTRGASDGGPRRGSIAPPTPSVPPDDADEARRWLRLALPAIGAPGN